MHECQEIWSANINQKEDHFLIYERDLLNGQCKFITIDGDLVYYNQGFNFSLFG
jgi:hypothetical protein